jgi:hypothetical protein
VEKKRPVTVAEKRWLSLVVAEKRRPADMVADKRRVKGDLF